MMKDLSSELRKIEEDFNTLKARVERNHIIFLAVYFLPPIAAILIFTKYFEEYFNYLVKGFLFALIVIGVVIHFILRQIYHRGKKRYKKFIDSKMAGLKSGYADDEEFKKDVVEAARRIFLSENVNFTNKSISLSAFWSLVFMNLGLSADEENN